MVCHNFNPKFCGRTCYVNGLGCFAGLTNDNSYNLIRDVGNKNIGYV